ncbi:MAG: acyl-CoA thioesterase [Candidatus Omnitrophica bacterium]|nr:acyl-CoA thioesterase [Candidatus Omnitrophota bacterium]
MHVYHTTIKLHETDAAGVLFFANQLKIIHDAYESLFQSIGFSFAELINEKDFFLPIVHSESDYKSPLLAGDQVEIRTTVANVGKTSFTLTYTMLDASQTIVGTAQTVHVSVEKATRKKVPLPADLRAKLNGLCTQVPC